MTIRPLLEDKRDTNEEKEPAEVAIAADLFEDKTLDYCLKNNSNKIKNFNHGVGKMTVKFAGNDPDYNWNIM